MPPLSLATFGNYPSCVRLLLERGAHVEATDHHGNIPLALAADFGYTECLELLLAPKAAAAKVSILSAKFGGNVGNLIACFVVEPWIIQRLNAAAVATARADQTSGDDD